MCYAAQRYAITCHKTLFNMQLYDVTRLAVA